MDFERPPEENGAGNGKPDVGPGQNRQVVQEVFGDMTVGGKGDLFAPEGKMGYSTPNLNQLAVKEGTILRNYYVQAESSPTRASLLTGKFPFKLGLQEQLVSGTTAHIPLNVPILPEMLKSSLNYETHLIGGWNVGAARRENTPTSRGFDTFYGYLGSEIDYYNKTRGKGIDFWDEVAGKTRYKFPARDAQGGYSTHQFYDRFEEILRDYVARKPNSEEQDSGPMYLQLSYQVASYTSAHHPDDAGRCKHSNSVRKEYCRMIIQLDDSIGKIRSLLEELNLWENSLIGFSTDSGGMVPLNGFDEDGFPYSPGSVGSNFPYRGSKTTLFEGGIRGVAFISGGVLGPLNKGKVYDGLTHAVDVPVFILSTAFKLAGDMLKQPAVIQNYFDSMDGISLPIFQENTEKKLRERTEIPVNIVFAGIDYTCIRFNRWKLFVGSTTKFFYGGDGWWPAGADSPPVLPKERHNLLFRYKLFDLYKDPLEENNVARNFTEIIKDGRHRIRNIVNDPSYREPQLNILHPLSLPMLHDGAWAPFLDDEFDSISELF